MRRLFPYVVGKEKKQVDCYSKRRRRTSILQVAEGGKMRRLFFTLLLLPLKQTQITEDNKQDHFNNRNNGYGKK